MTKHKNYHKSNHTDKKIAKDLAYEVSFGDISKVRELLATKPNINNILGHFDYPLFIAVAKTEKPELTRLFLDYAKAYPDKANVNILDDRGANAIIALSIATGNAERIAQIVQLLIDEGVDPTIARPNGYTALHAAVQRFNIPVARILLENGANPNAILQEDLASDLENITPLHYAALSQDLEMIELLVSYGADLALENRSFHISEPATARDIYAVDSDVEDFDQAVARGLATRAVMLSSEGTTSEHSTSEDTIIVETKKHAREGNEQSHDEGEVQSKSSKHSHATDSYTPNEANYHSESINSNHNDDDGKIEQINHEVKLVETHPSLSELTLKDFYSWIYELPEWMQNQLLSSTLIKTLIESAKQISAIYDIESIVQDFTNKTLAPELSEDSVAVSEHDIYEKVQISDLRSIDSIDMSMIWKEPTVSGWILPMIGMESGNMLGGGAAFNGHEIDVF